ncbi:hypothetical protein [Chitinilyticum aquatile]|uniref:hypothetical protein n=1 Tax=Chitinilyticum aquatile TaxID=362520 RepID=UPI0012DE0400|nr:hypothetical protein [Chitinilyticum aquatile]
MNHVLAIDLATGEVSASEFPLSGPLLNAVEPARPWLRDAEGDYALDGSGLWAGKRWRVILLRDEGGRRSVRLRWLDGYCQAVWDDSVKPQAPGCEAERDLLVRLLSRQLGRGPDERSNPVVRFHLPWGEVLVRTVLQNLDCWIELRYRAAAAAI